VPALRRLIAKPGFFRRPELYLAILVAVLLLAAVDMCRPATDQVTARIYIAAVRGYQHWGRPVTSRFVRCPYRPTCSEYSREAVEKFGLARGLKLTTSRLWRCRAGVRPGTPDPVP
jgi:putative component of membrane protein insertase Oxa1/YidC/SpoIIIJ protein YidD